MSSSCPGCVWLSQCPGKSQAVRGTHETDGQRASAGQGNRWVELIKQTRPKLIKQNNIFPQFLCNFLHEIVMTKIMKLTKLKISCRQCRRCVSGNGWLWQCRAVSYGAPSNCQATWQQSWGGPRLQQSRKVGNTLKNISKFKVHKFSLKAIFCLKYLSNFWDSRCPFYETGSSHHYKRNFDQAIVFHNNVLRLAHELKDHTIEARAYAGLGHAAR
jgi:hypothetical protein